MHVCIYLVIVWGQSYLNQKIRAKTAFFKQNFWVFNLQKYSFWSLKYYILVLLFLSSKILSLTVGGSKNCKSKSDYIIIFGPQTNFNYNQRSPLYSIYHYNFRICNLYEIYHEKFLMYVWIAWLHFWKKNELK